MSLVGKKVYHDKFGEGVIIEQSDFYVSVNFNNTCKRFVYPDCINSFLHLLDTTIDTAETPSPNSEQIIESPSPLDSSLVLNKKDSSDGVSMPIHRFSSPVQFYVDYERAITAEVVHLKKTGGKRQRLFDGKRIGFFNGRYIYTFESDVALNYPEGTQINIWRQGLSIPCRVMSCEEFSIIISIDTDLGPSISSIEFSAEPWQLLNALIKQLYNMCDRPSDIVQELICGGHKQIDHSNQRITTGQETAIKMSFDQPITFIWGPPGTGKTQTLAKIALAHIKQGNRVLMLSYSNVSVDSAIMRVHALSPNMDPGILLRYGYARQADLLNHDHLTSYNFTIRKHPDLLKEQLNLVAERKKLPQSSPRYIEIVDRLSEIKKYLSTEEKEYTKNASFVATTVSKAIVDATIYSTDFDTVIFDEASMAYVPQIVFSAGLAKKHFICMGDFCQLPPIVQSKNAALLSKDIFQYSGITSAINSGCNHKWLCLLDTQYRMHPTISDFVSQKMYNGLLRSPPDMFENRRSIAEHEPIANHAISFVDLSGTMSVCSKTSDNSRINVLSSFASFSLAITAAKYHEVGIITPYHSQSRLLHAMSQDTADAFPSLKPISCATVHQFQGSEKDVIIYDAVDCYRMSYPGMLLTSMDNNYANRLFNVAITRARGKFIGLANVEYLNNKNLSNKLMFSQLISSVQGKSSYLSLKDIPAIQAVQNKSPLLFYKKTEANEIFITDISSARREIHVDIPDSPVDDKYLKQLTTALQTARERGVKVYLRAESKHNLPAVLKPIAIENTFISNPVVLIDKKIIWFGMPSSSANFKLSNDVSHINYRPIIRFEGVRTSKVLYGFLEMNKTVDQCESIETDEKGNPTGDTLASYVFATQKCPSCGSPMKMQKNKNGKFFLSCTNSTSCKQTSTVDVALVKRYLYRHNRTAQQCIRCKFSLEAKVSKYGLYVQCGGFQHHRFKLDEI